MKNSRKNGLGIPDDPRFLIGAEESDQVDAACEKHTKKCMDGLGIPINDLRFLLLDALKK